MRFYQYIEIFIYLHLVLNEPLKSDHVAGHFMT
jgi:hypothetical protein